MATKSGKSGSSRTPSNRGGQKGAGGKKGGSTRPLPVASAKKSTWAPFSWGLPTGFAEMSGPDKIVWVCLHLLVVFVPIAMSNFSWLAGPNSLPLTYDQFDIAKVITMRALTLIALAAWSWQIFTNGGRLRRTKVDWLIVVFLGWVLLTSFTSVSPATAIFGKYRRFEGFMSFLTYAAVFFLVVQMVDRPSRIRSLARSLFFGSLIVSGYGLMQYAGVDPVRWGSLPFEAKRSFSTYGNPDLLGGYLMFPLPIALGLVFSEDNPIWRGVYWMGFFINAVCWITAFVRGAWIGGFVALVMLGVAAVWLGVRGEVRLHPVVDAFAGALTVGTLAAVIARTARASTGVMNFAERLKSILDFGGGSALTRFEIWEAAVNAVKARPILGFGADTFRLVFPKYKPLAYTKDAGYLSVADNVHDYPLQLASALGIPGFLLLYGVSGAVIWLTAFWITPIRGPVVAALGIVGLVLVVLLFVGLLLALLRFRQEDSLRHYAVAAVLLGVFGFVLYFSMRDILKRANGPARYLMLAFWAAGVAYVTHLFFGLSVTGSTVLLWFVFGVLMAPTASSRDVAAPSWGAASAVGVVIVAAVAFLFNVTYGVADNHYLNARVGQSNGGVRLAEAQAAVSLNPFNDMYLAEVGLAYQDIMIGWISQAQQGQNNAASAMQQAQQAFTAAETAMLKTIDFVPTEYDNYVFLANLYNQGGAYMNRDLVNRAVDVAKKGIEVEPYGPAIRFQLALAYNYLGDEKDAIQQLQTCGSEDPNYPDPQLLLGDIYRRTGDLAKAKATYEQVLKLQPTNTQAQDALKAVEASIAAGAKGATKK